MQGNIRPASSGAGVLTLTSYVSNCIYLGVIDNGEELAMEKAMSCRFSKQRKGACLKALQYENLGFFFALK